MLKKKSHAGSTSHTWPYQHTSLKNRISLKRFFKIIHTSVDSTCTIRNSPSESNHSKWPSLLWFTTVNDSATHSKSESAWNGLFPCSSKLWLGIQQIFLLFLIILQSQGKMEKIKEIIEWATAFQTHSVLLILVKPVIIHPLSCRGFCFIFMPSWTPYHQTPIPVQMNDYLFTQNP